MSDAYIARSAPGGRIELLLRTILSFDLPPWEPPGAPTGPSDEPMLKGIDPVLGPDLLRILAAMGHGDTLVVGDANFPADSVARSTATGTIVRLDGVSVPRLMAAILSLLPLDRDGGPPVIRMQPAVDTGVPLTVQDEVRVVIDASDGPHTIGSLDRFAFYDAARVGYAVVLAGDPRPYGCYLVRKGVIFGDPPG